MRKLWEAEHQRSSPACCSYLNTCLEGALALHQGLFRRSPDFRSSDLRIPTFPFLRVFLSGHQHSNDELREYDKRAAKHSQPPNRRQGARDRQHRVRGCGGPLRHPGLQCTARSGEAKVAWGPVWRAGAQGARPSAVGSTTQLFHHTAPHPRQAPAPRACAIALEARRPVPRARIGARRPETPHTVHRGPQPCRPMR